ncbi:MAG: hypothetical protein ACK52U_08815 [Synechococcaceae cyanobacterium]|jgi:hypothetical protein
MAWSLTLPIAAGLKDSNRRAIAAGLTQFLGVEEALPESFEGIPVLNNQKLWFFPYPKDRDPTQIDALRRVFQSGLSLADADTEQAIERFSRVVDAAMGDFGVAWNLSTVTPNHSLDGRCSRDWFAEVVATELRPLLQEYWFDAPDVAGREADRLLEGW